MTNCALVLMCTPKEDLFMRDFENDLRDDVEKAHEFLGAVEEGAWTLQVEGRDVVAPWSEPELGRLRLSRRLLLNIACNLGILDDLPINLRSSQLFAIKDLVDFLKNLGIGQLMGYLRQATGAGKTVLFGILVLLLDVKTLILVPSITLLHQTKKEFMEALGISEDDIGIVGDDLFETGKKITIATYASHRNMLFGTWDRDAQYRDAVGDCPFWVCDEGHRALGELTADSIKGVGTIYAEDEGEENLEEEQAQEDEVTAADLNDPRFVNILKLAFTATPQLQGKSVEDIFPTKVSEIGMDQLVAAHILVPYRVIPIEASVYEAEIKGVDISARKELEILERERVFEKLLEQFEDHREKIFAETGEVLKTAVFCRTISQCDAFLKVAEAMGFSAMVVTSRETKEGGDAVLREAEEKLLSGEIDFVITVNKLAEGWNFPPLNAAILARAILSPAVMIQACGRACRSFFDKRFAYIFEPDWKVTRENFAGNPKTFGDSMPPDMEEIGGKPGGGKGKSHLAKAKKPLRLVDALSLMGENVSTVCRSYEGELLPVDAEYQMPADGVLSITHPQTGQMVEVICISPYLENHHPTCLQASTVKFLQSKLLPVEGVAVSRGKVPVRVYLRSEADELLSRIVRDGKASLRSPGGGGNAPTRRIPLKLMAFGDDGSLTLPGPETGEPVVVVNLYIYAKHLGLEYKSVRKFVDGRGIAAIEVGDGVLVPGIGDTDLFLKEEVDKAVPAKDDGKVVCRIWDWAKNEWTEGVSMERYLRHLKMGQRMQAMVLKDLNAVGHVLVGERHFSMKIYRKDDVDAKIASILNLDVDGIARLKARAGMETAAPVKKDSIPNKLDANGVCNLRDPAGSDVMLDVVGLQAYSLGDYIDVEAKILQRYVVEAGLAPVCKVTSGTVVVDAYLRSDVDAAIIAARGHLKMEKLGENGVGFVEFPLGSGQKVEVVSIQGYANNLPNFPYTGAALRAAVLGSSLQPLPGVKMKAGKRGNAIVDVYRRAEVDAFIKGRWGIEV